MMRFAGFAGVWRFGRGIVPVFPFAPFAGYLRPVWAVIFPASMAGRFATNTGRGDCPRGYLIAPFGPVWAVWRGGFLVA